MHFFSALFWAKLRGLPLPRLCPRPRDGQLVPRFHGIRGFFSKLLSPNSPLARSDLDSPLKQMQLLLTTKNVAPSTAQAICEVVEKQLLGKKVGTLVGVKRAVRHALEDAVERILTRWPENPF